MAESIQTIQSDYMEFLSCAICSHKFEYENPLYRPITLPICGHTMCKQCVDTIRNQTKCPKDQLSFAMNHITIDQLPINYPLLAIIYDQLKLPADNAQRYGNCESYKKLDQERKLLFRRMELVFYAISIKIKTIIDNKQHKSKLSRSTIKKFLILINSQYIDTNGYIKIIKSAANLCTNICIDVIADQQRCIDLSNNRQLAMTTNNDIIEIKTFIKLFEQMKTLTTETITDSIYVLAIERDLELLSSELSSINSPDWATINRAINLIKRILTSLIQPNQ